MLRRLSSIESLDLPRQLKFLEIINFRPLEPVDLDFLRVTYDSHHAMVLSQPFHNLGLNRICVLKFVDEHVWEAKTKKFRDKRKLL